MIRKVAGAVVVSSALAVGAGGAAFASTPGASTPAGPTPGAGLHSCALAPKVVAWLQHVDSRITTVLPKLESAEQKAAENGHTKVADRLGTRIKKLENRQQRVTARIARIEKRCPDAAGTAPSGNTGGTSA